MIRQLHAHGRPKICKAEHLYNMDILPVSNSSCWFSGGLVYDKRIKNSILQ